MTKLTLDLINSFLCDTTHVLTPEFYRYVKDNWDSDHIVYMPTHSYRFVISRPSPEQFVYRRLDRPLFWMVLETFDSEGFTKEVKFYNKADYDAFFEGLKIA
jgi:hypothetical protein